MTEAPDLLEIGDTPEAWMDALESRGWGDGLPIVPPTPDRVDAFLETCGRPAEESLGPFPPIWAEATARAVAVNGVMAGMRPDLAPILFAAVEGILDPGFNLYALQATTNPVAPMAVVSGPRRDKWGIAYRSGCLGPGHRSNATLGRALRLCLLNIGGAVPGSLDRSTHGSPNKFAFVTGEHAERCPWETFHSVRGVPADQNAVTMFGITSLLNMADQTSPNADGLLKTIAGSLASLGTNTTLLGGPIGLFLSPEHAEILARGGHTRASVAERVQELSVMDASAFSPLILEELRDKRRRAPQATQGEQIHALDKPEDLHIVVIGGDGPHSLIGTSFGSTEVITRVVREPR